MGEKKLAVNNKKKRILNISLAVIGIIVVGLLFNKILEQWSGFRAILDKISSAFAPIIVGAVIAFLMNPILVFFDRSRNLQPVSTTFYRLPSRGSRT